MKKVSSAYAIQEDRLIMPPVQWSQTCMCCGGETGGTTLELEHKARYVSSTTGSTTSSSYFLLTWRVPYCVRCRAHAIQTGNLLAATILGVILLPIVLTLVLGAASSTLVFLLLLATSVVMGVVVHKVLLWLLITSKMTQHCTHHGKAIVASDDTTSVFFHFCNDQQAQHFAALNNAELTKAEKPSFWRLKSR